MIHEPGANRRSADWQTASLGHLPCAGLRWIYLWLFCCLTQCLFAGETTNLTLNLGGGLKMEFVLIRPGTFTMGSATATLLDQKPAHPVTIDKSFYLGK